MKGIRQVVTAMALAGGASLALAGPAFAVTAYCTNGYAYNSGTKKIVVVDSVKDTHQVEGQIYLKGSGLRNVVRAGDAANSSSSATYSTNINKFRVCRLELFDSCSTYKYL